MVDQVTTSDDDELQLLFPKDPLLNNSITDESFYFSPSEISTDDSLTSPGTSSKLTQKTLDWDQKEPPPNVMKEEMDKFVGELSNQLMTKVPLFYDTTEIGLGLENAIVPTYELDDESGNPRITSGDLEVPDTNEAMDVIPSQFLEPVELSLSGSPTFLTSELYGKTEPLGNGYISDESDPVLNFPPFDPLEYFSGAVHLEGTDADAFIAQIPLLSIDESMNIVEFTPSVTETNDLYNPVGDNTNRKKNEEAVKVSLKCKECPSMFKSKRNLNTHTRKNHPRSKKFGCTHCGTFFSANCNLTKHIKAVHYKIREHVCTVENCTKRFTEANKLDKHIKNVHEQQREFTCDRPGCNSEKNQFSQHSDLKRHIDLVHLKLFRYICDTCKAEGKKSNFGRRSSLFQHLKRIHKLDAKRASYLLNAGKKLVDGKEWTKVAPAKHSVSLP